MMLNRLSEKGTVGPAGLSRAVMHYHPAVWGLNCRADVAGRADIN